MTEPGSGGHRPWGGGSLCARQSRLHQAGQGSAGGLQRGVDDTAGRHGSAAAFTHIPLGEVPAGTVNVHAHFTTTSRRAAAATSTSAWAHGLPAAAAAGDRAGRTGRRTHARGRINDQAPPRDRRSGVNAPGPLRCRTSLPANAIRVPSSSATGATRAHGQARRLRRLRNSPPCPPDCPVPRQRCPASGPTSRSRSQPPRRRRIARLHFNGRGHVGAKRLPLARSAEASGPGLVLSLDLVCQRLVPECDRDGRLKPRDMVLTQPESARLRISVSC